MDVELVLFAIKSGADVNELDVLKNTPLDKALMYGQRTIINALIKAGAKRGQDLAEEMNE